MRSLHEVVYTRAVPGKRRKGASSIPSPGRDPGEKVQAYDIEPEVQGRPAVAPPKAEHRLEGRLLAEMAVEGDLMFGPAALRRAFPLHA